MHCQECGERPATLHFTKIVNGQKTEIHLCDVCAKDKGEMLPGFNNSFSIHNLLSGFLSFDQPSGTGTTYAHPLRCDRCGLTYAQFSKSGRFGCAHCYRVFGDRLEPLFKKVHSGNVSHHGKIPRRSGSRLKMKKEIELKKQKLQQAVANEEFELAAKLRDEIRELEKQLVQE
ncbi:protein-arginine kinase activator protein [Caldalkalibacillus thermarum]|uniref:UvrB/UvrC motif-containing protein n=1 Tax=Caldalkalibacillus thermarum TaxID=296745 RepID=UPI00166D0F20|nr:UvrB/UvrC motif-containing protein [Caldalkalibacillus thermarum]GGK21679.1 protein-arginine kinase activator protein [Caldalkalibacillus thermarum]